MPLYISVLDSNMNQGEWIAVQWDTSLERINANRFYSANSSLTLAKNPGDSIAGNKTLTEVHTQNQASATVIRTMEGAEHLSFNSGKVSKSLLKKFNL